MQAVQAVQQAGQELISRLTCSMQHVFEGVAGDAAAGRRGLGAAGGGQQDCLQEAATRQAELREGAAL